MDLHSGTPFWPRRDGILATHPPIDRDETCDVAVVGGGITGSLVALELARRGVDVIVVDRRDTGGGSTSASTSMLQYEIDELLVDLSDALGPDDAALAYQECGRGIDLVEAATQRVGHNCGFRRSPSVFIAPRPSDVSTLRRELEARSDAGFGVTWLEQGELADRWGLVGEAAIESVEGASVDPYQLGAFALARVQALGGRVFDRTAIVDVDHSPRRTVLTTNRGATIKCRQTVIATGYEVANLLPELPLSIHSSFALVSEPILDLDARYPDGLLFWDYDDPYLYGRTTDDSRLLIGGRDEPYNDPKRRERARPTKTRALARTVPKRFPGIGEIEVAFDWVGTFAETPDGLAYIGEHSAHPRMHFALGFGGNGITYSALAADYIAHAIEHGDYPDAARLFAVERPLVRPS